MSEPALGCQTLRKSKPTQVVLIHGLFSNGAFWVPYLTSLEDFQVTLLSVDYSVLLKSGESLAEVAARADALIGNKPAHLIAHSFGCWLGLYLKTPFLSRSFICPTFATREFDAGAFCADISTLTMTDAAELGVLVATAVDYKARHVRELRYNSSDHFLLPLDDPYFCYVPRLEEGATHYYRGGHFNVSEAVGLVAKRLAPDEQRPPSG